MNLTVGELSVPVIRAFAGEKECKGMRRGRALRRFDKELAKGNYKAAHSLLKQLQYKTGGLLGFGSAKLVPKRLPAMNGQELCMVDESLVDSVLCSIKYSIEFALSDEEVLLTGMEDDLGSESDDSPYEDHQMCLQHEAGHFLVGYLVGVLPRSYQVPRVEDITQDKFAQGNVQFLGFEFLKEVDMSTISSKSFTQGTENRAKISSQMVDFAVPSCASMRMLYQTLNRFLCVILGGLAAEQLIFGYSELLHSDVQKTLNRFLCVILGGLAAEHLIFGYSELLHSDVQKLDRVLSWLCLNENEANSLVRRAVLTTLSLLSHHHEARSRLAEAMASRRSIGYCIDMIESTL